MSGAVNLRLPGGAVHTFSLPLPDAIQKQWAAGVLKPVEDEPSPFDLDGEGDAERVSASPPVVEETPVQQQRDTQPKGNASHAEWVAYAVSQGMDGDTAAGLKRDEIKARLVLDDTGSDPAGED